MWHLNVWTTEGVRLGNDQGARVDQAHHHRLGFASHHRGSWPAQPAGSLGYGHGHGDRSHDLHPGGHAPCHRGGADHDDGRRASAGLAGRPRNRRTESPHRRTSGRAAFFIIYSS